MRNIILSILIILTAFAPEQAKAQIDPALTVMVLEFTETAKKQYESQLETMALETEGHIWLREEVKAAAEYQRQFDNYLNSFRNVIAYAAQAYGFYHEIDRLCKNMEKLGRQIGETPENAIALALHGKRNDIYVNIINKGVGIVNCIRQACIDKKMTEKERIELVFSIRPQLQGMNRQLAMLTKLVRHTTLAQVWRSIEGSPPKEGKGAIAEGCLGMWRTNARGVRP